MIDEESSFPSRMSLGLLSQDLIWQQFNDLSFFVEDVNKENLYHKILSKLFPGVKLSKVFPLGGKPNVIAAASLAVGDKKRVYILDLDFDGILKRKTILPNLFYLKRYSIENHMVEENGIFEYVMEHRSSMTKSQFRASFNVRQFTDDCVNVLCEMTCCFYVIQKYGLGVNYCGFSAPRDCNWASTPLALNTAFLDAPKLQIDAAMVAKGMTATCSSLIPNEIQHFNTPRKGLARIPGKYILLLLKHKLERHFKMPSISDDSFLFRLAKNCSLKSLMHLRLEIEDYTK